MVIINLIKGKSWKLQRALKKKPTPNYEETVALCNKLYTIQSKVLFALLYLTASRVTEIVQCPYKVKNIYKREQYTDTLGNVKTRISRNSFGTPLIEKRVKTPHDYMGLRKANLRVGVVDGKKILTVFVENRKNKSVKYKVLPVNLEKDAFYWNLIRTYTETLNDDCIIIPVRAYKAERMFACIDLNPHYLRDIRLTHLRAYYGFDSFELVKFAGWKDARPAENYIRLDVNDLVKKL